MLRQDLHGALPGHPLTVDVTKAAAIRAEEAALSAGMSIALAALSETFIQAAQAANIPMKVLFHFAFEVSHSKREQGAKPQTVLPHGKAKQRSYRL